MIAKIYITLKSGVLDPQGKTIHHALDSLGYNEVEGVRLGKYVLIHLNDGDPEKAKVRIDEMCQKLLANPVIEEYRFEIQGGV